MSSLRENFFISFDYFLDLVKSIGLLDIVDILLVAVILYLVYQFIRDRRASKLAFGVVILILLRVISEIAGLNATRFLMQNIFQVGLLALIIVFQPELRSALEKVGSEPLKGLKSIGETVKEDPAVIAFISELCDAVCDLSASQTGALIVLERETHLGDNILTGVIVNADLSSSLLKNIFFNKAPLHDGAVIIRNLRIHAAGCFLPLSSNTEIIADLGTRHRAGIGMSENSDAVVIIVSEETGNISIARGGNLTRNYNYSTLKQELTDIYIGQEAPVRKMTKRMTLGKK